MLPPCEFPNFPVFLHQPASWCSADSLVRAWLARPRWAATLLPPRLGQLGRPLQPSFWPKARLKCRAKSCIHSVARCTIFCGFHGWFHGEENTRLSGLHHSLDEEFHWVGGAIATRTMIQSIGNQPAAKKFYQHSKIFHTSNLWLFTSQCKLVFMGIHFLNLGHQKSPRFVLSFAGVFCKFRQKLSSQM